MKPLGTYTQGPGDRLDYSIDWSKVLEDDETIVGVAWSVASGVGLTIGSGIYAPSVMGPISTVWISGGTDDTQYTLQAALTTQIGAGPLQRLTTRQIVIRIRA